ncbi:MAG: thioredoxin-dependent thiol peroxidase [Patescibacteria group bacterium]
MLNIGDIAPPFTLFDQMGKSRSLSKWKGQWVLLYFYPRDNTPGCTIEACAFRDAYTQYERAGVVVVGMSGDSTRSHEKFSDKHALPFPIVSDEDRSVMKEYGAIGKKTMMGRTFLGIKRMSYLIDPMGRIAKIYDTVRPALHADEVLRDIAERI